MIQYLQMVFSTAILSIVPKNNSDTLLASRKEILLSNTGET
jgi:hypothetical protein